MNDCRWRVYLDSNFFIRFVESEDLGLLALFERQAANLLTICTSELTLAEVLVDPIRLEDQQRARIYEDMLAPGGWVEMVPVDRQILRRSADIRATIGNKLPDAIHVATAAVQSCNVFLSSDKRLRLPREVTQVALDEIGNLDLWP
jgi:predicted nucleic acid-binding protein